TAVQHDKTTDREDAALRDAGFDPAAAPTDAVARLRELRGKPGAADSAAARALGAIAHADAAAMLAELEAGATGALRREVRRALFRLRQRGIEPPRRALPSSPAPARHGDETGLTAYLTTIDPDGARIVWIVKPRSQGGFARLWGLASNAEGLVRAGTQFVSRREFRAEREEIARRSGAKFIEADWRLADFILCEAYRATSDSARGRVGGFLAARSELIASSPPTTELAHPVYAELGVDIPVEPPANLMNEPELAQWRLPESLVKPYVDEINRANESVIVVSQIQQQERVNVVIEHALGELFSRETGVRVRRRLEDIAYYVLKTGRRPAAALAASAARMIRDGADLKRNAFFQAFVRSQLGARVAEERQRESAEPRLIMTPAEAMRAQQQARRRR
ncbi:MAG: hypothetical protein ACREQF_02500, partial [Candidatus Binataceae bacterium]